MHRHLLLLLVLAAAAMAQPKASLVFVHDGDLPPHVALAQEAGIAKAIEVLGWTGVTVEAAASSRLRSAKAHPEAVAFLMNVSRAKAKAVARAAEERKIPLLDLGCAYDRKAPYGLTAYADREAEVDATAWWICGPFAHHHVGLLHGNGGWFKDAAEAMERKIEEQYPLKRTTKAKRISGKPEAIAKWMQREMEDGCTAFYVAAEAEEARSVALAAKLLKVPPVVVCSPAALGWERFDKREPESTGLLPEGTVVMELDLCDPEVLAKHPGAATILAMEHAGGPWAFRAFEATVALKRALDAAGDGGPKAAIAPLASGEATGLCSSFGGTLKRADSRALSHVPLIVGHDPVAEKVRYLPFPPLDLIAPKPRPLRAPYDPRNDLGPFSRWSTLNFETHPDTTRVLFSWGKDDVRTIEEDLGKMKICTKGRQPVLDHLVREKILARMLSITGEKYYLKRDGEQVPSKSFAISMVARKDDTRPKKTWPAYVAGDDPEAGGRAFGSYCFIYSTFIWRTIFQKFELLDDTLHLGDLPTMTGVGVDESKPYVTGTREDVLYRLIDNFAGSCALTAAHEVGHLASLGHDTIDENSIMNVVDGAGKPYQVVWFIPQHQEILKKTLGIVGQK